jgi:hypothetical protein
MPAEKPFKLPPVRADGGCIARRRTHIRAGHRVVLRASEPLEATGHLPYSVQIGQHSVDALRGKPMFEWLDDEPEFAAVFNEGTTSASETEIEPVVAAYDFSDFGTIVDVGGGHGRLLAAILRKTPQARGILFDAESVVAGAPAVLDAAGVADRTTVVGGSFFESVPSGGVMPMCSSTSCMTGMNPKCSRFCATSAMPWPPTRRCW